ncbi:MAG: aminoglycoside phosphotransferase family protein [Actinobacteria bacterium]|nr:aminoglycoside phosphotransferase family protein [Actinomycetota bacterium]
MLPAIRAEDEYVALLKRLEPWRSAVEEVLRRHGLARAGRSLHLGRTGTYPAVLVGKEHVVKLFGPWWCGTESFEAEAATYDLLTGAELSVPHRLGQGSLDHGWTYLLLEQLRGRDLAAAHPGLDRDTLRSLAGWLGRFCRALHSVPLPATGYLRSSWDQFRTFVAERREEVIVRGSEPPRLPPHLQAQLEDWLPPVETLLDTGRPPVLLHGDLHDHHVLGTTEGGAFRPTGVIDFTDTLVGDPYYELGPLFIHTLRADPQLLGAWLEETNLPSPGALGFPSRALAYTILHEFDPVRRLVNDLEPLPTLDAVAEKLFASCAPA